MSRPNLIEVIVDIKEALNNIKNISTNLNNFITQAVQPIKVNFDGTAITQGIKDVETQIKQVAEQTQNGIAKTIGEMGFAINAVATSFRMTMGATSSLITASNQQETATNNLRAALSTLGEATEENIASYQEFASTMQKTANVGDEAVLGMLSLATSMGIVENKRKTAVQGAIGLAKVYGIDMQTALKGVALAYEGEYMMLNRYIPALRAAGTEAEKQAVLQTAMANGFKVATAEVDTGAGALVRLNNQIGDFKEALGDVLKNIIYPFVQLAADILEYINSHADALKLITTSLTALAVVIAANVVVLKTSIATKINDILTTTGQTVANITYAGALGLVTGAIKTATVATLKYMWVLISNPIGQVVLIIGALVAGLGWLAYKFFSGEKQANDFNKAVQDIGETAEETAKKFRLKGDEYKKVLDEELNALKAQQKEKIKIMAERYTRIKGGLDYRLEQGFISQAEYDKRREFQEKRHLSAISAIRGEFAEKDAETRQKYSQAYQDDIDAIKESLLSAYEQIDKKAKEQLAGFEDIKDRNPAMYADAVNAVNKVANIERQKLRLQDYKNDAEIARMKVELNEGTQEQYQTTVTNYYNWVKSQYGKDTREYLDALRMKVDLTKQALAELQAIQKRFVSKEDTLAEQYKRDKEVLENTKALNEHYLADLDALYRDYNQARIDLRQKEADDKKRLNEESKSTEKQLLEDSLTLAEKRVQVTGEGYEKLTQAAEAYLQYCKLAYGEDSMEFYDAMQRNQQAIEAMKNATPSLQQAWQTTMDALAASAGAFAEMATGVLQGFVDGLGGAFADALVDGKNFGKAMEQMFKNLAKTAIAEITKILVQMALLKPLKLALGLPFASGGFVSGPGTPTSDSIPARLSNGEYVINAAKTRLFKPLLDVINYSPVPAIKKMFNDYAATIHLPLATYNLPLTTPRLNYATGGYVVGEVPAPPASDFTAMTERLDQVINSVEHLTTQMTNQMERLNQKDYNVKVESVIDGIKLKRVINKAEEEYKQAGLNG